MPRHRDSTPQRVTCRIASDADLADGDLETDDIQVARWQAIESLA